LKRVIQILRQQLHKFRFELVMYVTNRLISHVPFHVVRLAWYRHVMRYDIGCGSSIFMDAWFDTRGRLVIGKNSVINQRCRLDSRGTIRIGDNVSISAEVCILTADHDLRGRTAEGRERPVVIHDHVFIGTRAMILPGVTLGRGSAVAAGAVVTREVEPHTIVAGVPARPIGCRPTNLEYSCFYRRLFG
jgi:maltose O-acetyltransferase